LARKILLADDSVTAQNMGRKILADAGYEVIAVNNGSAALKKIAELKPDLVILDVYMPGYSGLEVCQRLKESPETARIPVLLSVGKLEPFKPDEAQRVRADAFIVKPFEASELLSALSKLEDKVVPRAEPSKPGRFARAMAAVEEASRTGRKETASDKNGWSSRIGFPHEKTGPEEKVADDSTIYNPFNKDLRTVVETAAEKAAEKKADTPAPVAEASKAIVGVAEAGLPKDVTPEEVAAIATAAAKIQMADAAIPDERPVSQRGSPERQVSESLVSGTPVSASQGSFEPVTERVEDSVASPVPEQTTRSLQEDKVEVPVGEAAATVEEQVTGEARAEEAQDPPVTMAAATAESVVEPGVGASRWTAVPVELQGEEATVSLEQEMQKAYAAYAPYVATEAVSDEVVAAQAVEAPAPVTFSSVDVVPVVETAPVETSSVPEVAPIEETVAPAVAEFAEAAPAFAHDAELAAPAAEAAVADAASLVAAPQIQEMPPQEAQPQEAQHWPEPAPATAEAATASTGDSGPVIHEDEPAHESQPDFDPVKSTAAAWASWRQIRDTRTESEVAQPQAREFEVPEPVPAEPAAMAAAAGAEETPQEVSAAPGSGPTDVASIVESVLANLRPKLMEEISRKMAEKK
jgi:CheY-like chemotaxis protein